MTDPLTSNLILQPDGSILIKARRRLGATPPCGHSEPESSYRDPHTSAHRTARCHGALLVVKGNGRDSVTDGSIWISTRPCPKCGWLTEPFSRIFAPETCNSSTMMEWPRETHRSMDEARGGGGDEIEYDTLTDTFRFRVGSGPSPYSIVPNPTPFDLLRGAELVARFADSVVI